MPPIPDNLPHPLPEGGSIAGVTILGLVALTPRTARKGGRAGAQKYRVRYECCERERVMTRRSICARVQAIVDGHPMKCSACSRAEQRDALRAISDNPSKRAKQLRAERQASRLARAEFQATAEALRAAPFASTRPFLAPEDSGQPFICPFPSARVVDTPRVRVGSWPVSFFSDDEKRRKHQIKAPGYGRDDDDTDD